MKDHPILFKPTMAQAVHDDLKTMTRRIKCPWAIGDILWVKEEHYAFGIWLDIGYTETGALKWQFNDFTDLNNPVLFPNDKSEEVLPNFSKRLGYYKRNSLFMPKKHCRTRTVITDIREERLQDITPEDALKEGIESEHSFDGTPEFGYDMGDWYKDYLKKGVSHSSPIISFETLWDSINGKPRKDGVDISWFANPPIFVISFERIEKDNK